MRSILAALAIAHVAAGGAAASERLHIERYVETRQDGTYIDWLDGFVGVIGQAPILHNMNNSVFYRMAKGEAEHEGRTRILKTLEDLRVEGGLRLGQERELIDRIEKLSRGLEADEIRSDRRPLFRVTLKLPLRGDGSVMELLVATRRPQPHSERSDTLSSASWSVGDATHTVTGLVLDARHLGGEVTPVPALLPRVVDPDGRVVYDLGAADPDFAIHRGLAAYSTAFTTEAEIPVRERPREGDAPLLVTAVGVSAEGADLVIRAEDADRILAAASLSTFLEECRVLVILPPPPPLEPVVVLPRRPPDPGHRAEDANLPQR